MIALFSILTLICGVIFLSHLLRKQAQKHAVEVSEHLLVSLLQEGELKLEEDPQEELWQASRVFSNVFSRATSPDSRIQSKELLTQVVRIVRLVDFLANQYEEQTHKQNDLSSPTT